MSYLLTAFRNAGGLGGDPNGLGGANHPTGTAPPSTPVSVPYTSSFEYFRNMQAAKDAEAARLAEEARLRELAAAEFAAAGSVEDRHKNLIKNMYGTYNGEFGGRVLTEDEFHNGWVDALGNYRQGTPRETRSAEELAEIRYRNLSHDWYNRGMDHFTASREIGQNDFGGNIHAYGNGDVYDEAMRYVRDVFGVPDDQGVTGPWVNTYDWDRFGTYNFVRDPDYNAFLGSFGRKQSNVDGYRDDSIAGYLKNAFAGQDQIVNRSSALRDFKQWTASEGAGAGLNTATDVMTQQYFDQLDLANKYGLTWEQAGAVVDSNGGGSNNLTSGNGMLSYQDSSWQDVLNRGGASLDNWDSLLGQYTYDSPLNWASMSDQEVENSFGNLFDNGGMFTQGKNRDLIYATLMENLGRG
jgi:hypothetical protein